MTIRPVAPAPGTPPRRPGWLRRTTAIDITCLPDGGTELVGVARDLRTNDDGSGTVLAEATVHAELDGGNRLRKLASTPALADPDSLVGVLVGPGFRGRAAAAVPEAPGTPLHLLVDDLPVATLIGGYARMREGARRTEPDLDSGRIVLAMADVCAGWQRDGSLLASVADGGGVPMQECPVAPPLADADDPLGWPQLAPVLPGGMRRVRRIDAGPGEEVMVDGMFRDSYGEPDGTEVVLHEYSLAAVVGRVDLVVRSIEATPRALPHDECPQAAASAGALVGSRLDELPGVVRNELVGTVSCTHLNDLLRSLAGLESLLAGARGA